MSKNIVNGEIFSDIQKEKVVRPKGSPVTGTSRVLLKQKTIISFCNFANQQCTTAFHNSQLDYFINFDWTSGLYKIFSGDLLYMSKCNLQQRNVSSWETVN